MKKKITITICCLFFVTLYAYADYKGVLFKVTGSGVTIGIGETGIDYTLIFDGEDSDSVITWMEDEDVLDINKSLTFSGGYERHIVLFPTASTLGPTAPTPVSIGTARGLLHDADAEQSFITVEIPSDWNGTSDIDFEILWSGESGDVIANGETVIHKISYRSIAIGEAIDTGTAINTGVTYTQSGAGTDKQIFESEVILDYDSIVQPLTAGDNIYIVYSYDATTSTYSGGPIVYHWEIKYISNKMPYN